MGVHPSGFRIRKPGELHTVNCNLCPLPLRVLLMNSGGRLSFHHIRIKFFDVLKLVQGKPLAENFKSTTHHVQPGPRFPLDHFGEFF